MLNIESVRVGENSEYKDSMIFDLEWFDNKFDNTINAEKFNGKEITADSLQEGLCIEIFAECVEYTVRNPNNVFFQMQDFMSVIQIRCSLVLGMKVFYQMNNFVF